MAPKQVRVALSGSGFKFPAHVGALVALEEAGYEIVELAGTSGGSIVSAMYASGLPLSYMKELTMTRDWSDMLSFNLTAPFKSLGYCSGDKLLEFIKQETMGVTFKELHVPLTIVSSDIAFEDEFVFNVKNTPDVPISFASRCSASIPLAYGMMEYTDAKGTHMLMDGGLWDNMPEDKLVQDDILRLGVRLVSKTSPLLPSEKSFKAILPRILDSMLEATENVHVDEDKHNGAIFAYVETGYASGLDKNMSFDLRLKLFNDGYAAVKAVLAGVK